MESTEIHRRVLLVAENEMVAHSDIAVFVLEMSRNEARGLSMHEYLEPGAGRSLVKCFFLGASERLVLPSVSVLLFMSCYSFIIFDPS